MRISTRQTFLNSVSNMQNSQSKLADLQNQIATGKKLNKPSDDPVAAAQVVKLNRELAQTEKFQDNIDVTQRRLELEETVLESLNNSTTRIRELTLQAGNGIVSDADRKAIATEIRGLVEYSAGLMNTQDSQGEYLFSGSQGFDKPYVLNGDGSYSYVGDDGKRMIQVAPELFVPSNDAGEYLFEAATEAVNVKFLPANPSFITDMEVVDEDVFAAFAKGKGDLQFEVQLDTTQSVPTYQYQFRDSNGVVVNGPTALPDIGAGESVSVQGLKFKITEPPVSDWEVDQQFKGIKEISVADAKTATALDTDIGDITLTFDPANNEFDLTNSLGNPVTIDGKVQTDIKYTPESDLLVGGYRLKLGTPVVGDSVTLGLPLQQLSPVSKIEVTDKTQYAAATADMTAVLPAVAGLGEVSIRFNMPASTYDLLDGSGAAFLTGVALPATPTTIALERPDAPNPNIPLGISLTVNKAPTDQDIVKLEVPAHTETAFRPEEKRQNILNVATQLATVLETPVENDEQRAALKTAVSDTLSKLDQVRERNLEARTTIGSRINALDNTKTSNEDFKLFSKTALSSLEDIDFAEAISELKLEEAILQAAQASFAKIQELSLFNFIR